VIYLCNISIAYFYDVVNETEAINTGCDEEIYNFKIKTITFIIDFKASFS